MEVLMLAHESEIKSSRWRHEAWGEKEQGGDKLSED
jgi:hypothetical protein